MPEGWKRLWGNAGPEKPDTSLDDAIAKNEKFVGKLDVNIQGIEHGIKAGAEKLNKNGGRRGGAAANRLAKQRLHGQMKLRNTMTQSAMNAEASTNTLYMMNNMQQSVKNAMETYQTLEKNTKTLERQVKKADIDKIERMQDKMADMMYMANEIQESLAYSFDTPDDLDEEELDAELEMLADEMGMEDAVTGGMAGVGAEPDFLADEVPEFVDEPPQAGGKLQEVAR